MCAEPARPRILGVKCLQRIGAEKSWQEGMREGGVMRTMGERDSWGGSKVTPAAGDQFVPKEDLCKILFAPNFTFNF